MLAFFVISAPFGVPVTPINLACGFLFGFFLGLAVALVGSGIYIILSNIF